MKKIFLCCLLLLALASSCSHHRGQIAFCFDDNQVDEWYAQRDLFKKYDIKATFFICRPQTLTTAQIQKLEELSNDGHEIACHGLNHRNAAEYCDSATVYYRNEVKPAVDMLTRDGFKIKSFAYPFGATCPAVDSMMVKHFRFLRKATYNIENDSLSKINRVFVSNHLKGSMIADAMGIDCNYKVTFGDFEGALQRCDLKNETLVVYSHCINNTHEPYSQNAEYLEQLFKICRKNHIKSVTFSQITE